MYPNLPDFTAEALVNGGFEKVTFSKYSVKVVLFFYPLDFTLFVPPKSPRSPTVWVNSRNEYEVLSLCDSHFTHQAWRTPSEEGGIGNHYPGPDLTNRLRATTAAGWSPGLFARTLIIDKTGVLKHSTINDLNLGRNIDEVLRLLDAIDFSEVRKSVLRTKRATGHETNRSWTEGPLRSSGKLNEA